MREVSDALTVKRLYIADLAESLQAMEGCGSDINAEAYRLFARRLLRAMAGYPERRLGRQLGGPHPAVREALAQRHFDAHGTFDGARGARAQRVCEALLWRLMRAAH